MSAARFDFTTRNTLSPVWLVNANGGEMAKRFITRIELTVPTRTKLTEVSHSNGMTQVVVLSRIVNWFAAQPEMIQAAILGRYPVEIQPDIAKLILDRMSIQPPDKTARAGQAKI